MNFSKDPEFLELLCTRLAELGVNDLTIDFSGEGDEGGLNEAEYSPRIEELVSSSADKYALLEADCALRGYAIPSGDWSDLARFLGREWSDSSVLGDWYDGNGGQGNVVLDVQERTLRWVSSCNQTVENQEELEENLSNDLRSRLEEAGFPVIHLELDDSRSRAVGSYPEDLQPLLKDILDYYDSVLDFDDGISYSVTLDDSGKSRVLCTSLETVPDEASSGYFWQGQKPELTAPSAELLPSG